MAEISLFGPGVGECIVIHYGEGRWFVVDSCLSPHSKNPIALEYLEALGVDVATQVTGVLVSHWHSDHIEGAYRLIRACENAVVQAPAALVSGEALNLACLYKKDPFGGTDDEIREFRKITEYLKKEGQQDRFRLVKARHTFFDDRDVGARLVALSPSDVATTQAIERIRELKPGTGGRRVRLVAPSSENLSAVALYFSFGGFVALLGADLEEKGNKKTGWSAVLGSGMDAELSLRQASVYKVAHHGSKSAHHPSIWEQMLIERPLAITTTYSKSRLPSVDDVRRIRSLASSFIVTRDPAPKKKSKRESFVERTLKRAKDRLVINDRIGHVQLRIGLDGAFRVARNPACIVYESDEVVGG